MRGFQDGWTMQGEKHEKANARGTTSEGGQNGEEGAARIEKVRAGEAEERGAGAEDALALVGGHGDLGRETEVEENGKREETAAAGDGVDGAGGKADEGRGSEQEMERGWAWVGDNNRSGGGGLVML